MSLEVFGMSARSRRILGGGDSQGGVAGNRGRSGFSLRDLHKRDWSGDRRKF